MQQFLTIARQQINLALDEQQHELSLELRRIMARASADGYLRSGRLLIELDRACAAAITHRGAKVWDITHRCITTGRVRHTPDLATTLKDFCLPFLAGTVNGLTQRAIRETQHMGMPNVQTRDAENARLRACGTLESEIDLFCAALSVMPQDVTYQPQSVIHVNNSSIANLQTGQGSSATVTQSVSTIQQEQARSALEELKRELIAANQNGSPLFFIEESEDELAKPVPDKSRLKSFAEAIRDCVAGTIETAPKIPAAIEAVQKAIAMLPM
jgi:hypothetical protein